jgi:hypothetical protein
MDRGQRRAINKAKNIRLARAVSNAHNCDIYIKNAQTSAKTGRYAIYDDKKYFFSRPSDSRQRTFLKRLANKRIRKRGMVPNYSNYRRAYDIWWIIY